jgi:Pentapeptide repeats (8 copies)
MIQIKHKRTGAVLHTVKADTLVGYNLSGANLYYANLSCANLSDADLSGADLSGADLPGAKGVKVYKGSAHIAVAYTWQGKAMLSIGCQAHSIEHWQEHYKAIGAKAEYTEAQIAEYGSFILGLSKESVE